MPAHSYIHPPFPYLHHGAQTLYRQTRLLWSAMSHVNCLHFAAVATLLLSSLLLHIVAQNACTTTASQPNPIAQQYPDVPTGTLNMTLAVVPIPMATARQLIPSQIAILEGAYRALLPDFPPDMYPVVMQAGLDHDIQLPAYGITVPDFQRVGWSFPFLDLLGDGYSSFTWAPAQMISSTVDVAIQGSRAYGTNVSAASFDPNCEAYAHASSSPSSPSSSSSSSDSAISFSANATDGSNTFAALHFAPLAAGESNPFPVSFYQNVTNQPIFANGTQCDNMIRLFNSTLNQGVYAPLPVKGSISSNLAPMMDASLTGLTDVFGLLIDTPFIEHNGLDCQSLKGYAGTGSGD